VRAASFALLLDGLFRGGMGLLRALGFETETVFDAPWTHRGLGDFWSRRWNRFVSRTLAHEVYEPAKRRVGRAAGVLVAFVASGVLHDALFVLAVGPTAWRYTAFFAVQGVGVVVEAAWLGSSGGAPGRRLARRALAWAVLVATAPLFFGGPYPDAVPLERGPG
jgi:D-alanyl-lipoteichoic acid acyltransferase DltB (MBOAT superfamily)